MKTPQLPWNYDQNLLQKWHRLVGDLYENEAFLPYKQEHYNADIIKNEKHYVKYRDRYNQLLDSVKTTSLLGIKAVKKET